MPSINPFEAESIKKTQTVKTANPIKTTTVVL